MAYSALLLAQIQYFFSLGFMLLFLALQLGLIWVLLFFKLKAVFNKNTYWQDLYRFWVRVFALVHFLTFAAFIAAIIQSIALWHNLIQRIGDVISPLVAAAFVCMFIIKAGVLGVMLFDGRRLSDFTHTLVVAIVAIGITIFSLLVLALLSWTQSPVGAIMFDGKYVVLNTIVSLFNPALNYYGLFFCALSALLVATFFIVITIAKALNNPINHYFGKLLKISFALAMIALVACAISIAGLVSFSIQHQPAKAAATAGYWDSGSSPDLSLISIPNKTEQRNDYDISLAGAAGNLLAKDSSGNYIGLDQYSGMTPAVIITFWSFRLMLLALLTVSLLLLWAWIWLKKHRYNVVRLSKKYFWLPLTISVIVVFLLYMSLAYVQFGAIPYAVNASITFAEIFVLESPLMLLLSNTAFILCYLALLFGFVAMLKNIVLYGVIPVTRRRLT